MPDETEAADALARECRTFTRYLAGRDPDAYIASRYARGHARIPYRLAGGLTAMDRTTLGLARLGSWPARAADGYSRHFLPTGALRQKLVLLYAVLENSPETHGWFNSGKAGRPAALLGGLVLSGLGSAIALLAGVVLIGPLHLIARLTGGTRADGGA